MGRVRGTGTARRLRAAAVAVALRGPGPARRGDPAVHAVRTDLLRAAVDLAAARGYAIDHRAPGTIVLLATACGRQSGIEAAVRAALDLNDAFLAVRNRWMEQCPALVAHTGAVVAVACGEVRVRVATGASVAGPCLAGPAVDAARRLCRGGGKGEVLVTPAVAEALAGGLAHQLDLRLETRTGARCPPAYRCRRRRARLYAV